jgi:hypothetical protein
MRLPKNWRIITGGKAKPKRKRRPRPVLNLECFLLRRATCWDLRLWRGDELFTSARGPLEFCNGVLATCVDKLDVGADKPEINETVLGAFPGSTLREPRAGVSP